MDIGQVLEDYELDLDLNTYDDPDDSNENAPENESDQSENDLVIYSEDESDADGVQYSTVNVEERGFNVTSLEACLVSNQMYQDNLRDFISQLENALAMNREKQNQVQDGLNTLVNPKSISLHYSRNPFIIPKFTRVFAAPYFRDEKDFFCHKNEDFDIKRANGELDNYVFQPILWSTKEKEYLYKSVQMNARKHLMEPLMNRKENAYEGFKIMRTQILWDETKTKEEREEEIHKLEISLDKRAKDIDQEIENIRNLPDEKLFSKEIQKRDIDWCLIANANLLAKRNETSCSLLWKHVLNPLIKKTWTDEEDDILTEMVEEMDHPDWDLVAEKLGEGRTSFTCVQRYLTLIGHKCRGQWSDEENEKLLSLIEQNTVNGKIIWNEIYTQMEDRERSRIRQHYVMTLSPEIAKGAFSLEEDLLIFLLSTKYGEKFRLIKEHFNDRTTKQVRMRYLNSLKERDIGKFSIEDDKSIVKIARENNYCWPKVAEQIGRKTSNQVYQRYKTIINYIPDAYQKLNDSTFQWPHISSAYGTIHLRKRRFLRNYIQNRLDNMLRPANLQRKASNWLIERCMNLARQQSDNYQSKSSLIIMPDMTPEELDTLIIEVQNIIRKKHVASDIAKRKPSQATHKRTRKEDLVDLEQLSIENLDDGSVTHSNKKKQRFSDDPKGLEDQIDEVFMKQLETLSFPSKKNDFRNRMVGRKAAEYNACSNVIHEVLGIKRVVPDKDSSDESSDNCGSVELEEVTFVNNKKVFKRSEIQLQEVTDAIYEHCIDKGIEDSNIVKTILPPTKATLEAFHTLILDRKRLGEIATSIGSASLKEVHAILGKVEAKCLNCQDNASINTDRQLPSTSGANLDEIDSNHCVKCFNLKQRRDAFEVMRRRYISMFFWPGLFSVVPAPNEDLDNIEKIQELKRVKCNNKLSELTKTGKVKKPRQLRARSNHKNSINVKARLARKGLLVESTYMMKKQQGVIENDDIKPKLRKRKVVEVPLPVRRSQRNTKATNSEMIFKQDE